MNKQSKIKQFKKFLSKFKQENTSLIESIENGFDVIFENEETVYLRKDRNKKPNIGDKRDTYNSNGEKCYRVVLDVIEDENGYEVELSEMRKD